MTPGDQVAQVAEVRALEETLVEHPVIVVDLGEILVAAVADESDHALRLALRAAVAQRRREQRARRGAGDDALTSQELAAGAKSLCVRDAVRAGNAREIGHGGHRVAADALHEPR